MVGFVFEYVVGCVVWWCVVLVIEIEEGSGGF